MTIHKIYTFTSIGRPVEWKSPIDRAMILLLAPAAMVGLAAALWQGVPFTDSLLKVVVTTLAAFGGWALGRELDPDDHAAAFVALVLSVLMVALGKPDAGYFHLLILFVTLGLVRQVNRSTGLEARISDSFLLLGLTLWVIYGTGNPLFGLVAGLSFAFDGTLGRPLRRQLLFALLSFGATVVYMVDHDLGSEVYEIPHTLTQWLAALAVVVFSLNILLVRRVTSLSDVSRRAMDTERVRGGMAVAVLGVAQGLPDVHEISLLAAAIAGVCLSWAFRRSFKSPA